MSNEQPQTPEDLSTKEAAEATIAKLDDITARMIAVTKGGVCETLAQHFEAGERKYEFFRRGREHAELMRNSANVLREITAERDRVRGEIDQLKAAAVEEARLAANVTRAEIVNAAREEAKKMVDAARVLVGEIDRTLAERRDELKKIEASIHKTKTERARLVQQLRYGQDE